MEISGNLELGGTNGDAGDLEQGGKISDEGDLAWE